MSKSTVKIFDECTSARSSEILDVLREFYKMFLSLDDVSELWV